MSDLLMSDFLRMEKFFIYLMELAYLRNIPVYKGMPVFNNWQ